MSIEELINKKLEERINKENEITIKDITDLGSKDKLLNIINNIGKK